MKIYFNFGAVVASALLLAACGQAQGDERSERGERSEENRDNRDSRDDRDSERGSSRERVGEATRDEARSDRGSEPRAASASDSTNQNFVMRNNTGQTIMRVYVSPVTSSNWGPDVLGSSVLPDRETARINFNRSEEECNWDIKVELADGETREQRNMNLCRLAEVEVTD